MILILNLMLSDKFQIKYPDGKSILTIILAVVNIPVVVISTGKCDP